MAGDIKKKVTLTMNVETKEMESQFKSTIKNIQSALSNLSKESDNMSLFQGVSEYIKQIDTAMGNLKGQNADMFQQMFGGMDESFLADIEKVFGIAQDKITELNSLKGDLLNANQDTTKRGQLQQWEEQIRNIYKLMGQEVELSGKGSFETRINAMVEAVNNFATVWQGMQDKFSNGLNFGSGGSGSGSGSGGDGIPKLSEQAQKEIDALEGKIGKIQSLMQELQNVSQMTKDYMDAEDIAIDFELNWQTIQEVINKFHELEQTKQEFEAKGDTSSIEYYQNLMEYTKVLTQLNAACAKMGSKAPELLDDFVKSNDWDSVIDALGEKFSNGILDGLKSAVSEMESEINRIKTNDLSTGSAGSGGSGAGTGTGAVDKQIQDNQKLIISYDELKQKVQEFGQILKSIDSGNLSDSELDTAYDKSEALRQEIMALGQSAEQIQEIKKTLYGMMKNTISDQDGLSQICNLLSVSMPSGAQNAKESVDSLTQSLQNMLQKATEQQVDLEKGIGNSNEFMALLSSDKVVTQFTGEDMKVDASSIVNGLVESLKENILMSLHNHPDGATAFTVSDIKTFAEQMYGNGAKVNGIIADGLIQTVDFTGISQEVAMKITQSYADNLRQAAKDVVDAQGNRYLDINPFGDMQLSKLAQQQSLEMQDQLREVMLDLTNMALNQAFTDNGLESTLNQYSFKEIPQLVQYLTQIQQSGENAITPIEKLKNLLTTMNPKTDFNWDNFKDIFAQLESGKISGGDAFGQSKARIAELQQQAEQATKVVQQFNDVVESANGGIFDVGEANNIEGQMDAIRSQIEELHELGQVSDETMQKVNEDYASVKSTIESMRGAANTHEELAGLSNDAQLATTIQQLEGIVQKRQELTNMAENAGWFNESELENEKAITEALQQRIDTQKQLAQEKLSTVSDLYDNLTDRGADELTDVTIGEYREQLNTLETDLKQLEQQGVITAEQLENAMSKIETMRSSYNMMPNNYTGHGDYNSYGSYWDEYDSARREANELREANEELTNELNTLRQQGTNSTQVAQGQIGNYQQTIDALNRIEEAIKNVVNAFAPLNQALSEEGGLFTQMAQSGAQAMQSLTQDVQNISQGFISVGEDSGISNILTQIEEMKTSLTSAMSEFKEIQNLFSGANFNLNLVMQHGQNTTPIARNAQYATAARETIKSLREQATELESVFKEVYKSSDGMQAVVKGLGKTGMIDQDKIELLNNLGNKSASLKVQMQTYRDYIALMQELATKSNIDLSKVSPTTSKSADQMVQDTEKILTGEKELEDSTNRLKSIFGSEIGISNLEQQITRVVEKLEELRAQLENLSGSMKLDTQTETFDKISNSLQVLVDSGGSLKTLVDDFNKIAEAAKATQEAIKAVAEATKETQNSNIAKDATSGTESKTAQSAQESSSAVAQEAKQMGEVATSAEEAAAAKEKFAEANASVNSSAKTSAQGLQEEASAMEEAAGAIEASQVELTKSRNESEKILGGMKFDTSDLDIFTAQINDFAHTLAESKDLKLSSVSVNMNGEYELAGAQITMINEKLGQTVTETYSVAHASEEMAEETEEAEQAMESLYLASVKVRQSNVDNSGNVDSTISKLKDYEDKVKSIRATFEAASNPAKPITDAGDLKEVNDLIDKINTKMGDFRDGSGNVTKFITKADQAELKSYLNDLQLLVKTKQNKDWVATSLRTKDASTLNSEFKQQLETFKASIQGSDVAGSIKEIVGSLETDLAGAFDKDSLTTWMNQFDLAKEKFKTLKAEFNATNKQESFLSSWALKYTELELYTQRFKELGEYAEEDKEKAGTFTAELERLTTALGDVENSKALANWGKEFTALQKRTGIMVNQIKEYDTAYRKMNEMKSNVDKTSLSDGEKNLFYSQFDAIQNGKASGLMSTEELTAEEQRLTSIYNWMMKISEARTNIKNKGESFLTIDEMMDENALTARFQNYADGMAKKMQQTMIDGTFMQTGSNSFQWLVQDANGAVQQIKASFDSLGKITIADQTNSAVNNAQKSLQGVSETLSRLGNLQSSGLSIDTGYIDRLKDASSKLQEALSSGDKGSILNATKDANKVVQDINKVIEAHQKMEAQFESGEATQIFPKDTTGSTRDQLISAVKEYASTIPNATVEIGKFDAVNKTLSYTITDSQNNMTTMKASVDSLTGSMSTQAVSVQRVATEWEKFKSGFAAKARSFTQYLTYMTSIYRVISTIKNGISTVKEIDSALTQLKIVTKESSQSLEEFANSAAESAQKVGSSITDLLSSVETWSRLGYSLQESLNLAEYTSMFSNVADIDIESATSSLTAILKAFGYEAQEVSGITDILTAVGANYAVSASELGEALQNGGSALEAAGNSLEESVALIAAGNASVQDASAVGNALKTTSMRIRSAKAELEDAGEEIDDLCESSSKMREEILKLSGVDIMLDDKNYKDTYQIMKEIAEVWDNMSDVSQAALLEDLAGKRNANTVKSIITNINDLTGAYETAQDAAGETLRANQKYMDSIEGRSEQFSSAKESFWKNLISADYIKNIVSDGTALINFLDTLGGKLTTLGVALSALFLKTKTNPIKMISQMFDKSSSGTIVGAALNTGASSASLADGASIEAYRTAIAGLSAEQQANVLASAGFSKAQIQATLAANGVTEATKAETLAEEASTAAKAAQEGATVGQVLAENGVESAKLSGAAATWFAANAEKVLTLEKLQEALASGAIDAATFAEIAAKMGLIQTNYSLGASIKAIFESNPLGLILMIVSAVLMAIPAIQSLGNAAEESAKRASEAVDNYKSKLSDLKEQKTDTEDLASTYEKLSKGVNTETNANIGLTTEAYEEYLDVCNQIADMYPQLVSGYDAQGNAIINLTNGVNALTDAYKEAEKAAAAEFLTKDNKKDIWDSYNNSVNEGTDYVLRFWKNDKASLGEQKQALEIMKNISAETFDELYEGLARYEGIIADENGNYDFSLIGDNEQFYIADQLQEMFSLEGLDLGEDEIRSLLQEYGISVIDGFHSFEQSISIGASSVNSAISASLSEVKQAISVSLLWDDDFAGLDETSQNIVKSIIGNMTAEDISATGATSIEELSTWVNENLVQGLVDDVNDAFDNASIYDSINNFSDQIAKAMTSGDGDAFKQAKQELQEYLQMGELGWEFGEDGFITINEDDDAITQFLKNMVNQLETQSSNYEARLDFKTDFEDDKPEDKEIVQDWLNSVFDEETRGPNSNKITSEVKSIVEGFESLELPDLSQKVVDAFAGDDGKLMSGDLEEIWNQGSTALESGDWGSWTAEQQAAWVALDAIMNAYNMDIDTVKASLIDLGVIEESLGDIDPFDFTSESSQAMINDFQSITGTIKDTWNSLNDGSMTSDSFISLMAGDLAEDANELMNGINFSDDNWMTKAKENLEALNETKIDDFITSLTEIKSAMESNGADTTYLNQIIGWAEGLKGQSLLEVDTDTTEITSKATTLSGLTEAQENYNTILEQTKEILYDGQTVSDGYYESLKEYIDDVEELDSCFDANNKQIVTNSKKLKALVAQQKKERKAAADVAKSQSQLQYQRLTKELGQQLSAIEGKTNADFTQIDALLEEISTVQRTIERYDQLRLSLLGVTDAYEEFQNAQDFDSSNDYESSLVDMLSAIGDGFDTGKVDAEAFKAAVKGIFSSDIYGDLSTVADMDKVWSTFKKNFGKLYTYDKDDNSFSITLDNMKYFVKELQKTGLLTGNTFDDFSVAAGTSLSDIAKQFGLTEDAAYGLLSTLDQYDFGQASLLSQLEDVKLDSDIQTATDLLEEAYEKKAKFLRSGDYDASDMAQVNQDIETYTAQLDAANQAAIDNTKAYAACTALLNDNSNEMKLTTEQAERLAQAMHFEEGIDFNINNGDFELTAEGLAKIKAMKDGLSEPTVMDIQLTVDQISAKIESIKQQKADLDAEFEHGMNPELDYKAYISKSDDFDSQIAELEDYLDYYEVTYGITPGESADTTILDKLGEWETNGATITISGDTTELDAAIDAARANAEDPIVVPVKSTGQQQGTQQNGTQGKSSTVTTNFVVGEGYQEVIDAITTIQDASATENVITTTFESIGAQEVVDAISSIQSLNENINTVTTTFESTGSTEVSTAIASMQAKASIPITQHVLVSDAGSADGIKSQVDALQNSINNLTDATINVTQSGCATVESQLQYLARNRYSKIYVSKVGGEWTGTALTGSSHASGTAHASGNWGLQKDEKHALVGELGRETVVNPNDGSYYTVGDNGAEFVDLPRGAIIFNHKQTEDLFKHGHINSRGVLSSGISFASGNAHASGSAFVTYTKNYNWTGTQSSTTSKSKSSSKSGSSSSSDEPEVLDWIEIKIEEIDKSIDLMTAKLENLVSISAKNSLIDEIINANKNKLNTLNDGLQVYENYANKLLEKIPAEYREMAKDGAIAITEFASEADKETQTAISNYREWASKVSETKQSIEELTSAIAELAKQKFDNISEGFENKTSLIEDKIKQLEAYNSYLETSLGSESSELYNAIIDETKKQIEELTKQRDEMQKSLNESVASGDIKKGSAEWYEMVSAISEVDTSIIESNESIIEFKKNIAEIKYDRLDDLIARFDAVTNEAQNLIDVLSNKDLFDEQGDWTKEGITSLGLHAQKMEEAAAQATQYGKEIEDLNKNWKSLGYTEQEYIEKLADLKDSQYESINAYYDERDAIVELNKQKVEAVKEVMQDEIDAYSELIDKKKEELSAEKDLHDFRNSVKDQEKDIAKLEKQLAAMAGDTSAAAIAKRKKLEAELAEARENLDETYYDHSITSQQEALDKELKDYQDAKDEEIEALEDALEEEDKIVEESINLVKENASSVYETLTEMGTEYGLSIADSITTPWTQGEDAIASYSDKFGVFSSYTKDELDKIKAEWEELNSLIDSTAQTQKNQVDTNSQQYQAAEKKPDPLETAQEIDAPDDGDSSSGQKDAPVKGDKVKVKTTARKWASGVGMAKWVPGHEFTVMQVGKKGDTSKILIGQGGKATGWIDLKNLEGYAKGTSSIKKSGVALIDELGEELVLTAGANGRLAYMTKGSSVIPSNITENLMQLGQLDPSDVLTASKSSLTQLPNISNNNIELDCSIGELIHIDNCTQDTLPDLQKVVTEALEKHTQKMNNALRKYVR